MRGLKDNFFHSNLVNRHREKLGSSILFGKFVESSVFSLDLLACPTPNNFSRSSIMEFAQLKIL